MSQHGGHKRRPRTPGLPVRSIRSFKSSEQYLEAMKEDLAEWLGDLYGLDIDAANFLQVLETGLVLCQHANTVTEAALAFLAEAPAQAQRMSLPRAGVTCNGAAQPGTFQARDNVSNFIQWCRKEMGIQEVLMFETEDLVLRKNVKNVVLCLLELGRRARRFGVAAPTLVTLEEEIDAELRSELALPPPDPPPATPKHRPCHFRDLDQMVQNLVSHCTCPVQFSMVKLSEGKYQVGDSNTLIFIRILRSHVMVRVGGGWDTLGHYLDKHDPCRCTSLSHKPGGFSKSPMPPVQHEVRVQDGPSQPQPTMTVSRSQSPLPPVDWKTYTSSSSKLRPFVHSPPRSCGDRAAATGPHREMTPFPRSQERPLTPSQKFLSTGGSLPPPQFSSIHRVRDPWDSQSETSGDRHPGELPRGRTPTSWGHKERDSRTHARALSSQRLQASEATTKWTSTRGPSPPPPSSSLIKPQDMLLPQRGASPQVKEPATKIRSSSPGKGPTRIPIRLSPAQPPTPGRFLDTENGGPMAELGRDSIPLRAVTGNLAELTGGKTKLEFHKPDMQVTAEGGEPLHVDMQQQEGRGTPLPLGRTKEQGLYHGLKEDTVAGVKQLEVGATRPQSTESGVIPRSGVYVPSLGGRWPEPGGLYDRVIQELSQGPPPLLNVDLGAWKKAPTSISRPAVATSPGSPKGKPGVRKNEPRMDSLNAKDSRVRPTPLPGGQDCSAPTVSAISEDPTPSHSDSSSDKAKISLSKGKRTLRKPQKVPSIYKLKLRPRIRPRRDHRPEKRPSRIPKPLAYLCLGPARVPPRDRLLRAELGRKGGASAGEEEEEERKRESPAPLESSSPRPLQSQGPQQLDQVPPPPEEESWV